MNKKIVIKNNVIFMFICNILILLLLLLFNGIYSKLNYWLVVREIMIAINVILLIIGIVFNVLFFLKKDKYISKKYFIIPTIVFVLLQVFNIGIVNVINKVHDSSYSNMTIKLNSFCMPDNYYCDSYEIYKYGGYNDFVSYKTYFDYNKKKNKIEIHTKYTTDSVISVEAYINSNKDSYSALLIKDSIKKYFSNFNCEVDEKLILKAFDKRFNGAVVDKNISYKVKEQYDKNKVLDKITTIIKLDVNK